MDNDFFPHFIGTFLAILSAGIVWVFKSAHSKHKEEMLSLAKFERLSIVNLTLLKDNFEFIDKWIEALKNSRPFSFSYRNYYHSNKDTYKLSNTKLIKELLSINYKLESTLLDFNNFYKSYWDIVVKINSIKDEEEREDNFELYNKNVQQNLEEMKLNYKPLKKDILNVIVWVRASAHVRKHSFFGYLGILNKDIFPSVNERTLNNQREILKKNMEELKKQ